MNEERARKILGDTVQPSNKLDSDLLGWDIKWEGPGELVTLNGYFMADTLEAVAWWMLNMEIKETI